MRIREGSDAGLLNLGAPGLISAPTLIFFITHCEAYSLFEEALTIWK